MVCVCLCVWGGGGGLKGKLKNNDNLGNDFVHRTLVLGFNLVCAFKTSLHVQLILDSR